MKKVLLVSIFLVGFLTCSIEIQPVSAAVTLAVSPASITFLDSDPDLVPSLAANNTVLVTVTVTGNAGKSWSLTHLAGGDLSPSIPISNVSWTVSPQSPFVNGSMSRSVPQTAASGTGNRTKISGTFTFIIANLWSYNTGSYSVSTTFTLSAP